MNQDDKLGRMANQIADFFKSYPDDQAVAGIHDHIVAFWTPKMRDKLEHQIAEGAAGLSPLVVAAMSARGGARSPVEKEAAGPAQVGEIGASDAG
jgi:formate dehydrogenase subunit delta